MISSWEHRKTDRCYLSNPIEHGQRYRVKPQGSMWIATRIRFASLVGFANVVEFVGSYPSHAKAMLACQQHDTSREAVS